MNFSNSDITGRRANSLSNLLRNTHLYSTPVLPREFREVGTQIEHNVVTQIPNRQIIHLPLYVSNDVLRNFSRSQLILYIVLSILSMRDMALYLHSEAHFDDVDL